MAPVEDRTLQNGCLTGFETISPMLRVQVRAEGRFPSFLVLQDSGGNLGIAQSAVSQC